MKSADVRRKFIEFYTARGHAEIPSAPLVPENDPTTLFTGSGMQPMIPYLLGQEHPVGTRLVDSQKCFRAQDIEEVGDNRHTTFFEMLGNWSLGDYFKKDQVEWIFDFLTNTKFGLAIDPARLFVSVFNGEPKYRIPRDEEAVNLWTTMFVRFDIDAKAVDDAERQGMQDGRIFYYDEKKNWWSRASSLDSMPVGEPGGPDSEVFFDFGPELGLHERSNDRARPCHPNCDCGRFLEICNNVFMTYKKIEKGFEPLVRKNIDFGGGLERLIAVTENNPDIFRTDLFRSTISIIERLSGKVYGNNEIETRAMRIVADHIKAAVMMMTDGVFPSNKLQGYVLRRLIRRALLYGRNLGLPHDWKYAGELVDAVAAIYADSYPDVSKKSKEIAIFLQEEAVRFGKTLEKGIAEIAKLETLDGKNAFTLYERYGFPWEMTVEIAAQKGQTIDRAQFESEFEKHKALSRTAAAGMFKGGLADKSEQTIKLHTAHHLVLAALQKLVDPGIKQRGSNITAERLRMDFNWLNKLTTEDIQNVEALVNQKIRENLPVIRVEMPREEAEKLGAQMEFGHKYPDRVSVYIIGQEKNFFSAEFCGGPHVSMTGQLGTFKIVKEESAGLGIRRIYAAVD
ncbi:MAG: alanine--tRNA ligase [Candidatus Gottesmanbacteria bacterium]|nr:alanine--tRNA ligase [Candidatus Gottesmanbacteria bacterium]